jgi:hypothetical protein
VNPATSKLTEWRHDALKFAVECFGFQPDDWQADALRRASGEGRIRLAMKACAGPGKTSVLAILGWHRLACFAGRGEHPKGAAVSITGDNLDMNLWPELSKWQSRSPFLLEAFEWGKTRIFAKDHPETWFLAARSFPKAADMETVGRTLSGLHSDYPFFLIDESGDIPPQIAKSAEQALSTCKHGLVATAGNTTSHNGLLYFVCSQAREGWEVITITGDPDRADRSPRVDRAWAKQQIETYGRDNAWVMAYILGEFPPGSINALLTVDEVEAALGKHLRPDAYQWSQKRLGIDVARFGDDRTVIFPRQGLAAFQPHVMRVQDTCQIAARAQVVKLDFGSEMEFIDDTGHWGHGVIDNMRTAGYNPFGIQFHGPAIDPRFKNRRAEMWMQMAEWIKRGGALPNMPELVGELTAPTYTFAQGKFQLEDKDMIKKRLGRSPDLGDALALTFALPDAPAEMKLIHPAFGRKRDEEYDPFAEA